MKSELSDSELFVLLAGKPAVSYKIAAHVINVSDRQIRRLVALGKLEAVGENRLTRKILTGSLARYAGLLFEISGPLRTSPDLNGPQPSSILSNIRASSNRG